MFFKSEKNHEISDFGDTDTWKTLNYEISFLKDMIFEQCDFWAISNEIGSLYFERRFETQLLV